MNTNGRWLLPALLLSIALPFPLSALPAQESAHQEEPPLRQNQGQPQSASHSEQGPRIQLAPSRQNPGNELPPETATPSGTSNDRLFWTLPNFMTIENAKKVPPLTSKAKFKVVLRTSFDLVEYPYVGFLAGISQAEDSEPGYGQGTRGYLKRYGASFADNTDENFWTGAILPSLLHQDPRYYQLGKGGFFHRAGYALSHQFITRSDLGHREFNFSEVAGSAISAGISNAYHPAEDRTFSNSMSVWWTQVAWDTVATVLQEFWPDIRRKASRHKGTDLQP